jgi:hypothetical protein
MRLRDMKYIGFKHQRENKQNSDKYIYQTHYAEIIINVQFRYFPP